MSAESFACTNAPLGCDGRVPVEGYDCAGPCNSGALEREVHRLITGLDDVADVRVWIGVDLAYSKMVITVMCGTYMVIQ